MRRKTPKGFCMFAVYDADGKCYGELFDSAKLARGSFSASFLGGWKACLALGYRVVKVRVQPIL